MSVVAEGANWREAIQQFRAAPSGRLLLMLKQMLLGLCEMFEVVFHVVSRKVN